MKRIISFTIVLALVLGSFSFVFASATSWDTADAANLQSIKNTLTNTTGSTIYYMISQINGAMRFSNKTLANWLSDIYNQLNNLFQIDDSDVGRRSITYWVREAVLDLDSLVGTGSGTLLYNVSQILSNTNTIKTATQSISNTVTTIGSSVTQIETDVAGILINTNTYLPKIYEDAHKTSGDTLGTVSFYGTYSNGSNPWSFNYKSTDHLIGQGFSELLKNDSRFYGAEHNTSGTALGSVTGYSSYNGDTYTYTYYSTDHLLSGLYSNLSQSFSRLLSGYASTQTAKNWLNLNDSTFTAVSATDGIYKWLQRIQTPIARLSYVHASDEEIEARELAADNQEAVVDNFINPTGSGSVSTTDIGSLSSAADSYKTNASTGASATGVWAVFDQSNYSWFSQTTANNLDTSNNNRKGSDVYDTPLLDSYYSYMTDYLKENSDD